MRIPTRCSRSCMTCVAAALVGLSAPPAGAEVRWTVTTLDVSGTGWATGINNAGSVVGMRADGSAWWLPAPGEDVRDLIVNANNGTQVIVGGINNLGQISGTYPYALGGGPRLVIWQASPGSAYEPLVGMMQNTLSQPLFTAHGINDAGAVVGTDSSGLAYVWQPGKLTPLTPQFGGGFRPIDNPVINNAGVVAGLYGGGLFFSRPGSTLVAGGSGGFPFSLVSAFGGAPLVGLANPLNTMVATDSTGPLLTFDLQSRYGPGIERQWLRPVIDPLPGGDVLAYGNAINDFGQIAGMTRSGQAALATPQGTLTWAAGGSYGASDTGNMNFSDARNWSLSDNPGAFSSAHQPLLPSRILDGRIASPIGFEPTVQLDVDSTVNHLYVGDAARSSYGGADTFGSLSITGGRQLTVLGALVVERGGTLISNGGRITLQTDAIGNAAQLLIEADGVAQVNGLRVDGGPLTNRGQLFAGGTLDVALNNQGGLHVQPGKALLLRGAGHVNAGGVIEVATDATMSVSGAVDGNGSFDVSGALDLRDGLAPGSYWTAYVHANGSLSSPKVLTNRSTLAIDAGGQVQVLGYTQDGGVLRVDGTLDARAGGGPDAVVRLLRGRLYGTGRINGDLFVGGLGGPDGMGTARFTPGRSPGNFTIDGNFNLLPGGTVELDVARGSDGLLVTDHVAAWHMTLNGAVHFKIAPGLDNVSVADLQFLDCGSGCDFGSSFSAVIDGGTGTVSYSAAGLSLSLVPAAVPEPASGLLSLAGLALLWASTRHRIRGGRRCGTVARRSAAPVVTAGLPSHEGARPSYWQAAIS